jgi:hypothetical protein
MYSDISGESLCTILRQATHDIIILGVMVSVVEP